MCKTVQLSIPNLSTLCVTQCPLSTKTQPPNSCQGTTASSLLRKGWRFGMGLGGAEQVLQLSPPEPYCSRSGVLPIHGIHTSSFLA